MGGHKLAAPGTITNDSLPELTDPDGDPTSCRWPALLPPGCHGLPLRRRPSDGDADAAEPTEPRVCYENNVKRHFSIPTGSAAHGQICAECRLLCMGNSNGGLPGAHSDKATSRKPSDAYARSS